MVFYCVRRSTVHAIVCSFIPLSVDTSVRCASRPACVLLQEWIQILLFSLLGTVLEAEHAFQILVLTRSSWSFTFTQLVPSLLVLLKGDGED